jgi:hypothetical protein
MSNQVLILPSKQIQRQQRLPTKLNNRLSQENSRLQSTCAMIILNEQGLSASDPKLSTIPSTRINPPQRLADSLLDWDDDERRSMCQKIFRRCRQQQQQQRHVYNRSVYIQQNKCVQQATISGIVSAPTIDLLDQPTTITIEQSMNITGHDERIQRNTIGGQTLLHLAAKLGHDDIIRILIGETSHATRLINARGQIPLLCAIEAGSTSTASILMEHDPLSLTCKDSIGSSVFHYATEQCNDIILNRAISLLKRISSSAARATVSQVDMNDVVFLLFDMNSPRHFND